ncbi:MAG: hypothetical protein PGN07_06260 [Aeromicrobium erythreum]
MSLFRPNASGDPTCVDLRVRRVEDVAGAAGDVMHTQLARLMFDDMTGGDRLPPAAASGRGMPRYVFEEASESQLLRGLRSAVSRSRQAERLQPAQVAMLLESNQKVGRPPKLSLREKLETLAAIEAAYASDVTMDELAADLGISRSSLRDLLTWARHKSDPRLFTSSGHGRRGGAMTPEALELLEHLRHGDHDG